MDKNSVSSQLNIKAIVTAAGLSSRMGDFKPLMLIGEKTIAERTIDCLLSSGAKEIIVVTGYRGDELEEALRSKYSCLSFVRNEYPETTQMFDSVKLGLKKLTDKEKGLTKEEQTDRLLFCPIDVPMVKSETVQKLACVDGPIVIPQFQNRSGHPIVIDTSLVDSIIRYEGDNGLKGALQHCGVPITKVNVLDPAIAIDADTQEDYKRILELLNVN